MICATASRAQRLEYRVPVACLARLAPVHLTSTRRAGLAAAVVLALAAPSHAGAQDPARGGGPQQAPPSVEIPRLEATVIVDGVLDEPAWTQAARLTGFWQYRPADGRPAEERTEVAVWFSPTHLHLGIEAFDSQPSAIRATIADRDALDREDTVTVFLDTFNDRRRAFFFGVNPLGSQEDGVQTEGAFNPGTLFGGAVDKNPDYQFDSKGRLTPEGYVVEVRIPFKSLRYPSTNPMTWGLNIVRKVQRTGHEYTWTDTRRVASFLAQAGTVRGLGGIRRGVVTEIQPFVTASVDGVRDSSRFRRGQPDPDAGVNLRFGFTNVSIDATVNPDFSQVESDAGLVTINERFALFVPEKRPFFLEGIELFSTPNRLVYTRRIEDPLLGGKVTGKFGRLGVAWLTALDEQPGDHVLFNVARLRTDVGRDSLFGLTYTDRAVEGSTNRVLAADTRLVFRRFYYVQAQAGASWSERDGGMDGAPLWSLEYDRTAPRWGFNYKLDAVAPEFQAGAGFVPRTDLASASAFNRLTWYGAQGRRLESLTTFFGGNLLWRYDDFLREDPIEGELSANFSSQWRGGWNASARVSTEFVDFVTDDYAGYARIGPDPASTPFVVPPRLTGLHAVSTTLTTPTWQWANARLEVARGRTAIFQEAGEGREFRVTTTLGIRPTTMLRLDLTHAFVSITRVRDGSEFARTILPRLRLEYQPLRSLFFRMVGEYRAERRAALLDPRDGVPLAIGGVPATSGQVNDLRLDWLVSFRPTPGTIAFFGYGTRYNGLDRRGWDALERQADGFFLKLAYQIRR